MSFALAGQTDPEIAQLRQEVKELRAMLQANMQAQKSLSQQRVELATTATPQAIQPTKQGLTKSGAEFNLYGYIRADASYQMKGHLRCITILAVFHLKTRQKNLHKKTSCTVRLM